MSECPFCGRDPFHYVDNGVGMEAVAVTCCELGDQLFRGNEQWQPIETAPKDRSILLGAPGRSTEGHWLVPPPVYLGDCGGECRCPEYEDSDEKPGWWSMDGGFTEDHPPTHWRPLPAPPSSQPDDHQSAPVLVASHNSGEGEPAVTPACAGADTCVSDSGQFVGGILTDETICQVRAGGQLPEYGVIVWYSDKEMARAALQAVMDAHWTTEPSGIR